MKHHHTSDFSSCPYCGYKTDAATGVPGQSGGPSEGDFGLCAECHQVCVFDKYMHLRLPTSEELATAMSNDTLLETMAVMARMGPASQYRKRRSH